MIFLPKIGQIGVTHIPIAQGDVPAAALQKAAGRADGQDSAGQTLPDAVAAPLRVEPMLSTISSSRSPV